MTNILATIVITIVTNVAHYSDEYNTPIRYSGGQWEFMTTSGTYSNQITTVSEITTYSFLVNGHRILDERGRVISRNTKRWTKKETWVEEGQ